MPLSGAVNTIPRRSEFSNPLQFQRTIEPMSTKEQLQTFSNQIKSNQKRIYIAPYIPRIQRRLADGLSEVGAMIQISFLSVFLK